MAVKEKKTYISTSFKRTSHVITKWLKEESLNLGTGTFWCMYCNNMSARLLNYYIMSRTLILKHFIYA